MEMVERAPKDASPARTQKQRRLQARFSSQEERLAKRSRGGTAGGLSERCPDQTHKMVKTGGTSSPSASASTTTTQTAPEDEDHEEDEGRFDFCDEEGDGMGLVDSIEDSEGEEEEEEEEEEEGEHAPTLMKYNGIGLYYLACPRQDEHASSRGVFYPSSGQGRIYQADILDNSEANKMRAVLMCSMGPPEGGPDVFPPLGYPRVPVGIFHGGDGHTESLKKYPNVQEFPQGHLVRPQGTHHTKLWLIFYGSFIRVCVLTANNVKHHLENQADAVWVQDFPLKKRGSPKVSDFETDLRNYLDNYNDKQTREFFFKATGRRRETTESKWCLERCGEKIDTDTLMKFDFSDARGKLICSVPYVGPENCDYGYPALKRALEKENFDGFFIGASITYQCTSFGGICVPFYNNFLTAISAGSVNDGSGDKLGLPKKGTIRIVYPSENEVHNSHMSEDGLRLGGQVLAMTSKHYKSINAIMDQKGDLADLAPKLCLWGDGGPGRCRAGMQEHGEGMGRLMPHSKTLIRWNEKSKEIAWILLGSHNLSMMAWGHIGKEKDSKFIIPSFEVSVILLPSLFPKELGRVRILPTVRASDETGRDKQYMSPGLHLPDETGRPEPILALPLPYSLDAHEYDKNKGDTPFLLRA